MLDLTALLRVPQVDTGLRFDISPDGRHVVYAWDPTGNWEIYEQRLSAHEDREAKLITHGGGAKFSPHYSPDSKQLAYGSSSASKASRGKKTRPKTRARRGTHRRSPAKNRRAEIMRGSIEKGMERSLATAFRNNKQNV